MLRLSLLILLLASSPLQAQYHWKPSATETLEQRLPLPAGASRSVAAKGSYAAWLRGLPLKEAGTQVLLFNGQKARRQDAAAAIVDIDIGSRDLQQCADAVIRLRAEFLFASGQAGKASFKFTNGFPCDWKRWSQGLRPVLKGKDFVWKPQGQADAGHDNYRRYLDFVFAYAGTQSLARDLKTVKDPASIRGGDVLVQGGSPGHAVTVIDVARGADGKPIFLLAQSYMPAQSLHILKNLAEPTLGAWFRFAPDGSLKTPDWDFAAADLKRFE
ncbi:MAG: hypothetical protein RL095_1415 [Verrucomicrobiota bacterium]|jgi:hypothetical protein